MAAAFQTSLCLIHDFFFGQIDHDIIKVIPALLSRTQRDLDPWLTLSCSKFCLHLFQIPADRNKRSLVRSEFTFQIAVDHFCTAVAVADCLDSDTGLIVGCITNSEYTLNIGAERIFIDLNDAALIQLHIHAIRIDPLTNGCNDRIHFQCFKSTFHRNRASSAACIRRAELHDLQFDLRNPSVLGNDLRRIGQEFEDHALFDGLFNFLICCRHLIPGTSVDNIDVLSAKADCTSAGIHSCVAAADHCYIFSDVIRDTLYITAEEFNSSDHAFRIFTGASDLSGFPCANGNDRSVCASADLLKSDIRSDMDAVLHMDAHILDQLDFFIQNIFRQSVFRNTVIQHTAHLMHSFINGDIVAFPSQKESSRQTGRTAADNSNLLACRRCDLRNIWIFFQILQSGKSLQVCNRDRGFHILPSAVLLTWMRADRTNACRQRESFFHNADRIMIIASADGFHISHTVCTCRAAKRARSFAVAIMIAHQKLQSNLSSLCHTLGIGIEDPSVTSHRRAAPHQLWKAFALYQTYAAGAVVRDSLIITKCRNINAVLFRDLEDGVTLISDTFFSIYNNLNLTHNRPPTLR